MRTPTTLILLLMLVLPVSVSAEQIKLHCDIHYRGLYDNYSVAVDLDTGRVRSTNKHGVSETTQSRSLNPEMIVYNGDSFYVFAIDRTTLSMERTFEINGNYAGQGSCRNVATSDRQI